ncbi:hypothetical protein ACFOGI_09100 [Virgibacillus xinjiangensis]|uniref:Uncharacterized protein n=1 Tax=Virgibacillus xinjiangensis TaxID=393090 RepID=A0ABV7CV98_9BACI
MQQQPGQSSQQNMMMEPPQVLSTKDTHYLSDMLNWNLIAAKKANFYARQCSVYSHRIDPVMPSF